MSKVVTFYRWPWLERLARTGRTGSATVATSAARLGLLIILGLQLAATEVMIVMTYHVFEF